MSRRLITACSLVMLMSFGPSATASSPFPSSRPSTRSRDGTALFPTPSLALHRLLNAQTSPYLSRLTRELEKKFSDRHVVFIAQRRTMRKPGRTSRAKQPRPRSRTLKEVHERTLDDLVYPAEITGKRTRQGTDGNKTLKVYVQ